MKSCVYVYTSLQCALCMHYKNWFPNDNIHWRGEYLKVFCHSITIFHSDFKVSNLCEMHKQERQRSTHNICEVSCSLKKMHLQVKPFPGLVLWKTIFDIWFMILPRRLGCMSHGLHGAICVRPKSVAMNQVEMYRYNCTFWFCFALFFVLINQELFTVCLARWDESELATVPAWIHFSHVITMHESCTNRETVALLSQTFSFLCVHQVVNLNPDAKATFQKEVWDLIYIHGGIVWIAALWLAKIFMVA